MGITETIHNEIDALKDTLHVLEEIKSITRIIERATPIIERRLSSHLDRMVEIELTLENQGEQND